MREREEVSEEMVIIGRLRGRFMDSWSEEKLQS